MKDIQEDVPTNNVGGGAIAGIGTGDQAEPGVDKKKKGKILTFKQFFTRLEPAKPK
jgi:hypothetical protein